MKAGADCRHGHRVSLFPEQRGASTRAAKRHGRSTRRSSWRFYSDEPSAQSQIPVQPVRSPGARTLSVSADEFRSVLGRFPSGVTVVTTKAHDGADHGMTVSAFASVSLEPPLVLISIEKTASAYAALTSASGFVVNILSASQEQIARRFAIVDIDRFEGVGYS